MWSVPFGGVRRVNHMDWDIIWLMAINNLCISVIPFVLTSYSLDHVDSYAKFMNIYWYGIILIVTEMSEANFLNYKFRSAYTT